jgi:hypothetical protein
VGRDPDGRAYGEESTGDGRGKVALPEVNAGSRQPSHVHAVVDENDGPGLPAPAVRLLDRLEQVRIGQVLLADLEKPDAGAEQAGRDLRDLSALGRSARADRVDRRRFQGSV